MNISLKKITLLSTLLLLGFAFSNGVNATCVKTDTGAIDITTGTSPVQDERIFNVCASSPIGIKILIKEIKKYFPTIKIKNIARNNADVKDTFGSNKKIVNILGIKKFTNYKIGLKKTIKWYTQNFL